MSGFSCVDRPFLIFVYFFRLLVCGFFFLKKFNPVFCSMLGVDPHVPHLPRIGQEENWDDWLCQGWLWGQPNLGKLLLWRAGTTTILGFPSILGIAPGVAPRVLAFALHKS